MTEREARHEARRRQARRRRKNIFLRFVRAYRKAPMAVRLQVAFFFLLVAAGIGGLVTGGVVFAHWVSGGGSGEQMASAVSGEAAEGDTEGKPEPIHVYRAKVSDKVRGFEDQIVDACNRYKIGKYSELALAMIQQESDGVEPDVMQSSECGYNKEPPIENAGESINCGIQYLRDCLRLARVRGPADIDRISLAIQGYNYGAGYIRVYRDGEGYTTANALTFSENMKERLHTSVYGDPQYVPHVLRYYKKTNEISKTGHRRDG